MGMSHPPFVFVGTNCVIEPGVVLGHVATHPQTAATSIRRAPPLNVETFIGNNVTIRSGTVVYAGVMIGDDADISHNVVIRSGSTVGAGTYIKNFTEIQKSVVIGPNCRLAGTIADRCVLADSVSSFGTLTHLYNRPYDEGMHIWKGPSIGSRSIVGRGAIVIGDISVGSQCLIAAGAVLRKSVPDRTLVFAPRSRFGRVNMTYGTSREDE